MALAPPLPPKRPPTLRPRANLEARRFVREAAWHGNALGVAAAAEEEEGELLKEDRRQSTAFTLD